VTDYKVHAPYNFVPLPERVVEADLPLPDHDRYYPDRHTGYFDVTLTTETPLFIRGMLTEPEAAQKEKYKDKSDFFQLQGQPIIPGPSLRGMIRGLVEIISFSKLQPITDRLLIYRAVGDTTSYGISYRERLLGKPDAQGLTQYPLRNVRAGYLERNGHDWTIRPTKTFHNESFVLVPVDKLNAAGIPLVPQTVVRNVYVQPVTQRSRQQVQKGAYINLAKSEQVSLNPMSGLEHGMLIVSGKAPTRKYHPVIFDADPNKSLIEISGEMWKVYEKDRDITRGTGTDTRPLQHQGDPLFYLVNEKNELVFFGPTMMFRLPPRYTLSELIPVQAAGADAIDITEATFGWVAREPKIDSRAAFASRISVTDAYPTHIEIEYYEREFTPKILSGPKPTTFQHYLEQPDKHYTEKTKRKHYENKDSRLRGHKLYWRQKGITVGQVRETGEVKPNDKQHTKMRPVKSGISFTFRVYFENLSNIELGALTWALTLPASPDHRHQLGMGKPYGMGVVKLGATLTLTNRTARYRTLFSGDNWQAGDERASNDALRTVISEFESHIMTKIGRPNQDFLSVERIKELCVMLTPQQQDTTKFSYMQIEGLKGNEYKDRPVLPYPSVFAPSSIPQVSEIEIPLGTMIEGTVINRDVMSVKLPDKYGGQSVTLPPDPRRQNRTSIILVKIEGVPPFRLATKDERRSFK